LFSLEGNAHAGFDVAAIIPHAGRTAKLDRSVAGLDSQSAGKVPANRRAAGWICRAACWRSGRCPRRTRGGSARDRSDPTYRRARSIGNALRIGASFEHQTREHDSERELVHLLPHQNLQSPPANWRIKMGRKRGLRPNRQVKIFEGDEITARQGAALVLLLPEAAANVEFVRAAQAAGPAYKVAVSSAGIHNANEVERAVTTFAEEPNGGLIALPNPISGTHRALIAELAIRHRMPTIAPFRNMVASGVLASYGIDVLDLYRRAAEYIDRILKGEKPGELPVQGPTKFELIINLKTAKALGLDIPPLLLARADEVIE
jgi:hypothetical protein